MADVSDGLILCAINNINELGAPNTGIERPPSATLRPASADSSSQSAHKKSKTDQNHLVLLVQLSRKTHHFKGFQVKFSVTVITKEEEKKIKFDI